MFNIPFLKLVKEIKDGDILTTASRLFIKGLRHTESRNKGVLSVSKKVVIRLIK